MTADSDGLPPPVAAAIDAASANDLDSFLACFAPDGVVDDWGREFRGLGQIPGWSDREFIGVRVSLEVTEVSRGDGNTVVTANVGGDGFNGPSHVELAGDGERVAPMSIRA